MTAVLSELFEAPHVGDLEYIKECQLTVPQGITEWVPLNATVRWVRAAQGELLLQATVEPYNTEKHTTPETYQRSKAALFKQFQDWGALYNVAFENTPLNNTESTFYFRLPPVSHYPIHPKETRATLKKLMGGLHPYMELKDKPSLLAFAVHQTPTVNTILHSLPGRDDLIYQTAMNKQKAGIINKPTNKDVCIHHFLSLLAMYSNNDNLLCELHIVERGKNSPAFRAAFNALVAVEDQSFEEAISKVQRDDDLEEAPPKERSAVLKEKSTIYRRLVNDFVTTYQTTLTPDETRYLHYLAKLGKAKWGMLMGAMREEDDQLLEKTNIASITTGLMGNDDKDPAFINRLLQLDDAIQAYIGITGKDRQALMEYFNVADFGIALTEESAVFTETDVDLNQVNLRKIQEAVSKQADIIRKINDYFIENNYPDSSYFSKTLSEEEKEQIPSTFSVTARTKTTVVDPHSSEQKTIVIPAYIRAYLVNRLAYQMDGLAFGVGSRTFHLEKKLLVEDNPESHTYDYEVDNEFEPTLRITENTFNKLHEKFQNNEESSAVSFGLIGETDTPLMQEECLRSIFDFYDDVTQNATGILQPDTEKYYASTIEYRHTEDEAHHINRVEVTVTDKEKRLPGRVESFSIEGKRISSRGKNRITYAVMAESFKEAGAKRVKIRVDLKDIEENPHLKEKTLREMALKRMTRFAEELIKRGIDFSVDDHLPEKFGSITKEDITKQLSRPLLEKWENSPSSHMLIAINRRAGG